MSHLFADDLLFFAEASLNQVLVIKSCLSKFKKASGQKVNFAKSHHIFWNLKVQQRITVFF